MTARRITVAGVCTYCRTPVFPAGSAEVRANPGVLATRDHVYPQLWATGSDPSPKSAANVVVACAACNNVKGGYPVEPFLFFMRQTRGTARFSPVEFKKFIFGLALAGWHVVRADAESRLPPDPPLPTPRGRFTKRDLRRAA